MTDRQSDLHLNFYRCINSTISGILTFAIISLASLPGEAHAINASYAVGSIEGKFSVDQGSASYTIPIKLPKGVAGMEPELAISYNSNAGNGLLGQGFSLDGLSVIHRCGATWEQDGFKGGIYLDERDRYCLDGQRLISVNGDNGGNSTEYRTEIDSFSRIVSHGSYGNGPQSWSVETKSGQTITYGNNGATIEAGASYGVSGIVQWGIDTIEDSVGNQISYHYDPAAVGYLRLQSVQYAGISVGFTYESRPDVIRNFSPVETLIEVADRLSKIAVSSGGGLVHEYRIGYIQTALTSRSLLSQVKHCTSSGECLPPTTFEWISSDDHWGFGEPVLLDSGFNEGWLYDVLDNPQDTVDAMYQDMDGDGWPERIYDRNPYTSAAGFYISPNNGDELGPGSFWSSGNHSVFYSPIDGGDHSRVNTVDVNRDGLADRLFDADPYNHSNRGLHAMLNNGTGLESPVRLMDSWGRDRSWMNQPIDRGSDIRVTTMDLNGDGLADRVTPEAYDYSVRSYTCTKYVYSPDDGISVPVEGTCEERNYTKGIHVLLQTDNGFIYDGAWDSNFYRSWMANPKEYDDDKTIAAFHDMNGDGLPDRAYDRHPRTGGSGFWITLNNGSGFDEAVRWLSGAASSWMHAPSRTPAADLTDMNGDGLIDKVMDRHPFTSQHGFTVLLNNGSGFEAPEQWLPGYSATILNNPYDDGEQEEASLVDVNADGLPDRIFDRNPDTGSPQLYVKLNTGTGFEQGRAWMTGLVRDWMYSATEREGGYDTMFKDLNADGFMDRVFSRHPHNGSAGLYVTYNKGKQTRIHTIRSGLGNVISVEYAQSNQLHSREPGAHFYPDVPAPVPAGVVTTVTTDDGIGGTKRSTYAYGGRKVNVTGRGNLGYAWIESTDESTGIVSRTEYNQSYPFVGQVSRTEQRLSDGTLIAESSSTFEDTTSFAGTVHFPHVTSNIQSTYELDGTLVKTVTTENGDYDAYGNVGRVRVLTDGGGEQFETLTVNTYTNDAANWHLGRLIEATVTSINSTGDSQTRTSSFSYSADTGLLESETIAPDAADPLLTQTTTYTYDQYGNKIRTTVTAGGESRSSSASYTADGRFAASSSNAMGHTDHYQFDPALGLKTSLTGPNGLTTGWAYDGFGRKTAENRADGTSTTITRAWAENEAPGAVYKITTTTSGSAPKTVYFDVLGREVRSETIGFDGRRIFQDKVYDNLGRIDKASLPYFEDEAAYWVETDYDILGRPLEIRTPGNNGLAKTNYSYAGLVTTETNALNQTKTTTRNALDKVIRVDEEEGTSVAHTYDAYDNLIATDANGVVTTMKYDAHGRKTEMNDPDMGHWEYRYNAFGELVWQKDAKNQVVTIQYDVLGRKTERIEPEGETNWYYDDLLAGKAIGKLTHVTGPDGFEESYSYDAYGRPSVTTTSIDDTDYVVTTEYDTYGRVSKVTRPEGFEVTSHYNDNGYLLAVKTPRSQIGDYDQAHIQAVLDEALAYSRQLLETAIEYEELANYYRNEATYYTALAQQLESGAAQKELEADQIVQPSAEDLVLAQELRETAAVLTEEAGALQQRADQYKASADSLLGKSSSCTLGWYCGFFRNYFTAFGQRYLTLAEQYQSDADTKLAEADALEAEAEALSAEPTAEQLAQANQLRLEAEQDLQLAAKYLADADDYLSKAEEAEAKQYETEALYADMQRNINGYRTMVDDPDNVIFWRATERDAAGRLSGDIVGNGLATRRNYSPATGQLMSIESGFGYDAPIRELFYEYDNLNNMTNRADLVQGMEESFQYDSLNRLTHANVQGQIGEVEYNDNKTYAYDALGNITNKSDVGRYTYGNADRLTNNAGPHALISAGPEHTNYQYDANGNILSGGGRRFEWSSDNKPTRLENAGTWVNFQYAPDRSRYKKERIAETTVYIGKAYEKITTLKEGVQTTKHKHFIYAGDKLVAIHIKAEEGGTQQPDETRYLHRDSLGSIDTITDGYGHIVDRMSYDPFGKRRGGDWRLSDATLTAAERSLDYDRFTNRGFTGHEHIDELGLIHMNGRVYDPALGRFLSADIYVQSPDDNQTYNRYAYARNNPLKYTDPSGHIFGAILGFIFKVIVAATVRAVITGVISKLQGGSFSEGFKAGFKRGIVEALLFFAVGSLMDILQVGQFLPNFLTKAVLHGTVGGLSEEIASGDFKSGFLAAAVPNLLPGNFGKNWFGGHQFKNPVFGTMQSTGQLVARMVVGGVSAKLGGGKFANGAMTAAFGFLFNDGHVQKKVVDNTQDAWDHYKNGNGESVELGPNTKNALMVSEEQKYRSDRIRTGRTSRMSGNYGVNLEGDVYHVGDTAVQYDTVCSRSSCTTTYTGFTRILPDGGYGPDGFWDIYGGNDTIGPQGELPGGSPYPYTPYEWSETYPNPY